MKITEIRIWARNEEKLKAFANITFDDSFVVHGCKIIQGPRGYFVSMPSQKREDGTYRDIVHPINAETRNAIEETVISAYMTETGTNNEM